MNYSTRLLIPNRTRVKPFAKGLPAGPRWRLWADCFSSQDAVDWVKSGKKVILVREETNPEDVEGMRVAEAILTARGMTSHAALGCPRLEMLYRWL